MYLDGQLPGGPPSTNTGGAVNPNGVSALDGSGVPVLVSPLPGDLSGSTFFTVPGGGPVVISPSLATKDGVVQYPVNPLRTTRADNKPRRNAPSGWAAGNPSDWAPASCGLGAVDPDVFQSHYGRPAPDPVTCLKIQCGAISQAQAGSDLIIDCMNAGYAGVKSCKDPACAPYCPTQQITPGPAKATVAARLPSPPDTYVPIMGGCPGYGSDGSLITLRNDAQRRNAGLSGCCQSGYQVVQDYSGAPSPGIFPLLLGLAGLALLVAGGKG